ncbi:MAG: ABC transporter ATP-binding protein [Limnobacter sp.]|nr:ABC transporter ATP-binding protein [Limnobacter sp.]
MSTEIKQSSKDRKPFLKVEGLAKNFAPDQSDSKNVFQGVNFDVQKGEFICIIGHSGCGKSTILNILAGLDEATEGYVFMNGKQVVGPSLERGVVFQNHALMPWMSALKNVEFGVRSKWPEKSDAEVQAHAMSFLEMVGLKDAARKKPFELSGGMKQRVGIARAFAIQPDMLLLDEPFGALDALTRGTIQDELLQIVQATHQTVFMITHDVDEAILLADRILLMSQGPEANIAEIVEVTMPRDRKRTSMHHHPQYYPIRNHLVDFLVNRAGDTTGADPKSHKPEVVQPGKASELRAVSGKNAELETTTSEPSESETLSKRSAS